MEIIKSPTWTTTISQLPGSMPSQDILRDGHLTCSICSTTFYDALTSRALLLLFILYSILQKKSTEIKHFFCHFSDSASYHFPHQSDNHMIPQKSVLTHRVCPKNMPLRHIQFSKPVLLKFQDMHRYPPVSNYFTIPQAESYQSSTTRSDFS